MTTHLRDAARALRATPLVTAVAVLSLALGIGANTAMFSIVDALVIRALPVRHAERLTLLRAGDDADARAWPNPVWEAIRDRPALHDGAFAFSAQDFDLAERGVVDPVEGLRASGAMFDVLGVPALLGRTFTPADDRVDGGADGPVAVISHGFWQRRFGGARDVVGRAITLNRVRFTIVGVTPPSFFGPEVGRAFDVAVPLGTVALLNGSPRVLESRSSWWLRVMIRLRPGQTPGQATAVLRALQPRIADETRPTDVRPQDAAHHLERPFTLRAAADGASDLRGRYRQPLFVLLGVVGLTLLIACGNIANLLLARATARHHELSVRTALGASPGRLARQLLSESLVLAGLGGALGVGFAYWGSRLVVAQLSTRDVRVALDVGVDWRVLAFTAAVAVGTALLFGTVPAWRAARVAPIDAMKEQGRGTSSGRRVGLAGALVIAQVALSLVLLVGAGLLVRSFASLATRDLGFEPERVLVVHLGVPGAGVPPEERARTYERLLAAVRSVPGVSRAALSSITPVQGDNSTRMMEFPGRPELPEAERRVWMNHVTPSWFATLGMPLLAGRDFDDRDRGRDRAGAVRAVIVNRAFATKYFGAESPLGRVIVETRTPTSDSTPLQIVGVVGDAVYRSPREPVPPTMYWAVGQQRRPLGGLSLVVRATAGEPAALVRRVTAAVASVNPELTLVVRPLADDVGAALTQERLVATLSGFFGALALLLAALGLYGVTAYAVTRRHIELGIRMALGTTPAGVMRLVLGRVALLVGGGVAVGALVAWWATAFVESLLFGLAPRDPATIAGSVVVLAAVGAAAGWLPALRAARVDPSRVLRDD